MAIKKEKVKYICLSQKDRDDLKKWLSSGKGKTKKPKKSKRKNKKAKDKYRNYLKSDAWAQLKIDLYNQRGRNCEICGSSRRLEVHHLTYKNVYKEEPEDLLILCRKCHQQEHRKPKRR